MCNSQMEYYIIHRYIVFNLSAIGLNLILQLRKYCQNSRLSNQFLRPVPQALDAVGKFVQRISLTCPGFALKPVWWMPEYPDVIVHLGCWQNQTDFTLSPLNERQRSWVGMGCACHSTVAIHCYLPSGTRQIRHTRLTASPPQFPKIVMNEIQYNYCVQVWHCRLRIVFFLRFKYVEPKILQKVE